MLLTSDHGFHFGQFALRLGKYQPYETDVHVTLAARGPGVRRGHIDPRLVVVSVDLAPTLIHMAKGDETSRLVQGMDGTSFLPLLREEGRNKVGYLYLVGSMAHFFREKF